MPNTNGPQHSTAVIRGKDFMPETLYSQSEYRTQIFYSSVTTGQNYIFRGNSIYDPDQTGIGSTTIGFNIFSTIYSYYESPSSTIQIEWVNNSSVPMWLTVAPVAASIDTVNYLNAVGIAGARTAYVESTHGSQHGKVYNSANTKSMLGLAFGDVNTRSGFTGNPPQQWYWKISLDSCDNATSLSGVLNVTLRYKCKFTGRKIVS